MSEVFRHAADIIYRNADLGAQQAEYFAPDSSIGVECWVLDEPANTLSDIGGFSVSQSARILSAYFPAGVEPQRDGTLHVGTDTYRVSSATADTLRLTYSLDLEAA